MYWRAGSRCLGCFGIGSDFCWSDIIRPLDGILAPNPHRFAHGIPWLSNYAHVRGAKLGLYLDYGVSTCQGYPGSEGFLRVDALTLAEWGVDSIKMDCCATIVLDMGDVFPAMTHFINATGRPILYWCRWPGHDTAMNYSLLPPHCHVWRNYGDVHAKWESIRDILDKWGNESSWADYAGLGHWNDPDQIVVGMQSRSWSPGLNEAESRTQFGLWSILAAPLMLSVDLRNVSHWAAQILKNNEVIAVDQDALGKQGRRVTPFGENGTVWARELVGADWAVAAMNRGEVTRDIEIIFAEFAGSGSFAVRDLWAHIQVGVFEDKFVVKQLQPHDTAMYRISPERK
jgi:alpha-N-acetylgalactosaminidase